ncbi:hypothetical protein CR513_43334, partial [Mucuna pruriens]
MKGNLIVVKAEKITTNLYTLLGDTLKLQLKPRRSNDDVASQSRRLWTIVLVYYNTCTCFIWMKGHTIDHISSSPLYLLVL